MPIHRFAVGQLVRLKSKLGLAPGTAQSYRISATLPETENSPQYRIRNEDTNQERVVEEFYIEESDAPHFQPGLTIN